MTKAAITLRARMAYYAAREAELEHGHESLKAIEARDKEAQAAIGAGRIWDADS